MQLSPLLPVQLLPLLLLQRLACGCFVGSHLAGATLDDHETVLANGSGLLGEGEGGTGVGGLKGLVICSFTYNTSKVRPLRNDTYRLTSLPAQCCTVNIHAGA